MTFIQYIHSFPPYLEAISSLHNLSTNLTRFFSPYVYKIYLVGGKTDFLKYLFYKQFLPTAECAVNKCHVTMQLRRRYAKEIFHGWWCKKSWKHAHLSKDYM
jgi:hypothetical protein